MLQDFYGVKAQMMNHCVDGNSISADQGIDFKNYLIVPLDPNIDKSSSVSETMINWDLIDKINWVPEEGYKWVFSDLSLSECAFNHFEHNNEELEIYL